LAALAADAFVEFPAVPLRGRLPAALTRLLARHVRPLLGIRLRHRIVFTWRLPALLSVYFVLGDHMYLEKE